MPEIDFMSVLHKSTHRDYLARVNDPEFPKAKAAELSKQFAYDYWDDRRSVMEAIGILQGDGKRLLALWHNTMNYHQSLKS